MPRCEAVSTPQSLQRSVVEDWFAIVHKMIQRSRSPRFLLYIATVSASESDRHNLREGHNPIAKIRCRNRLRRSCDLNRLGFQGLGRFQHSETRRCDHPTSVLALSDSAIVVPSLARSAPFSRGDRKKVETAPWLSLCWAFRPGGTYDTSSSCHDRAGEFTRICRSLNAQSPNSHLEGKLRDDVQACAGGISEIVEKMTKTGEGEFKVRNTLSCTVFHTNAANLNES